jgi:hypothetical protein
VRPKKLTTLALAAALGSLLLGSLLHGSALHAQDQPAWQQRLDARHKQLLAENGPGTNAALRTQLEAMGAEDQRARGIVHGQPLDRDKVQVAPNLAEIDLGLTDQLKAIVAAHGWPTLRMVGYEASNAALLILIHSRDHAWQHAMIPQLEALAHEDKIDGSQVALLVDKELVAAGSLQRYGTQFKFVDGQAMMIAVEDPSHLEERREQAMLPPMSVYKQQLSSMYHLPVSDIIVRPGASR